jgi:hypothetical protein
MLDMHSQSGMHPYFGGPLMRKWLVFVLLLGILVFTTPAGAQGAVNLKTVNIELWSEYDQPSMLVIHEFLLDESTPLPAKVTIRFPKDGNLTAAAYKDLNQSGQLITTEVQNPETEGSWQTVTLNVESYVPYRIEYYQPLERDGNKRSFTYQWFGDYPVGDFNLTAKLPSDSTNISSDPAFTNTTQQDNFLVGTISQKDLQMGQSGAFRLSYERESETVIKPANSANIQPSAPIGPSTAGRVSTDNLPWIIGGIGLALIGLALFFYWRSTQAPEGKSRRRHRSGSSQEQEESGEQAYCHECGARAHPGDRFCRTCGSKIRV